MDQILDRWKSYKLYHLKNNHYKDTITDFYDIVNVNYLQYKEIKNN